MPKKPPAIPTDFLLRELDQLPDEVRLLDTQVFILTGVSPSQLRERARKETPEPPFPVPRLKKGEGVWWTLGSVRDYLKWLPKEAAIRAELRSQGFPAWLNGADLRSDPWPFALVGPYKRPVDVLTTIRGEVRIEESDTCQWLSLGDYLDLRAHSAQAEAEAVELAERVAAAQERVNRAPSGEGLPSTKINRS